MFLVPQHGFEPEQKMVLDVGFELTTYGLQDRCTTTVLIQRYIVYTTSIVGSQPHLVGFGSPTALVIHEAEQVANNRILLYMKQTFVFRACLLHEHCYRNIVLIQNPDNVRYLAIYYSIYYDAEMAYDTHAQFLVFPHNVHKTLFYLLRFSHFLSHTDKLAVVVGVTPTLLYSLR